jgi:D-glycero-alpha-D-manno-heptose-7-phosphate kinase
VLNATIDRYAYAVIKTLDEFVVRFVATDQQIEEVKPAEVSLQLMKESLLRGDFKGLVESMRMGWENKKRSAKTVSNPHNDAIYDAAVKAGALAGKVSGAGGGGFMWFFVPTEMRMDVMRTLNAFGGQVSNCHFTEHGTQAWRIA